MQRALHAIRNFFSETRGSMAVEAVLILPVMSLMFIFFNVYWDAYRTKNLAQKATYTIADIISRERAQIVPNYAKSFVRVFNYAAEVPGTLNVTNYGTSAAIIRVTSVTFTDGEDEADDGQVNMVWSISSDPLRMPEWTNDTIAEIAGQIPAMLDGDNIIVVESRMRWQPKFTAAMAADLLGESSTGWFTERDIETMATVRPRFVPRVCFSNNVVGAGSVAVACEL
jgi:hypothetical protein